MRHSTHTTEHPQPDPVEVRTRVPRPAGRGASEPGPEGDPPGVEPAPGARRRRLRVPRLGVRRLRVPHVPRARLTGFGGAVLATAGAVAGAWLSKLLGGAPEVFGGLFVAAAVVAALWVRPADLVCAPVAAPLAFAVGLLATGDGLTRAATELALRAPWLFAGTLAAAAVVLLRRAVHAVRRARRQRQRLRDRLAVAEVSAP